MLFEYHSNREAVSGGRLLNISILRVISMLMIVMFHCMCYCAGVWQVYPCPMPDDHVSRFASWVVSMALPFFFFISGYLYLYIYIYINNSSYRNWKAFIFNKFKRLIIPTVTWTVIYLILLPFRYSAGELLSGIRHLWFLPTLFCLFIFARLITPLLLAKHNPIIDVIFTVVLIVLAYAAGRFFPDLLPGKIFTYIGFFVSGMVLFKHQFSVNDKWIESAMVIALVGLHSVLINIDIFPGQGLVDIFVLIAITYLLLDLLSVVKMGENSKSMRLLNNLDSNSMGIYLVHQVLIMTLYQYTMFEESWLTYHPYLGTTALFLVIFPLSWAFAEAKRRLKLEPYL